MPAVHSVPRALFGSCSCASETTDRDVTKHVRDPLHGDSELSGLNVGAEMTDDAEQILKESNMHNPEGKTADETLVKLSKEGMTGAPIQVMELKDQSDPAYRENGSFGVFATRDLEPHELRHSLAYMGDLKTHCLRQSLTQLVLS